MRILLNGEWRVGETKQANKKEFLDSNKIQRAREGKSERIEREK